MVVLQPHHGYGGLLHCRHSSLGSSCYIATRGEPILQAVQAQLCQLAAYSMTQLMGINQVYPSPL